MPTNNKTSLGLNSWAGTDKPMRSDFVADNALLDSLLGAHFGDAQKHLSADDRLRLTQGISAGMYTGNGAGSQDIALSFSPRLVLVFGYYKAPCSYSAANGYTECNVALVAPEGGTQGVFLDGNTLSVCQSTAAQAASGVLYNLNADGENYVTLAFR